MTLYEDFLRLYHEQDLKKMSLGIRKLLYEQMDDLRNDAPFSDMELLMDQVEQGRLNCPIINPDTYMKIWICWKSLYDLHMKRIMGLADFKWEPETPRPLNFTEEPRSMDPYRFEED
jgi:hypothetical protein